MVSGDSRQFGAWGQGRQDAGQGTCAGGWRGARAPLMAMHQQEQAALPGEFKMLVCSSVAKVGAGAHTHLGKKLRPIDHL